MKFPACICQTDLTLLCLFSGVQWIKVKQKGHAMIYKRKRKPKGQSGMDNPHTHATLGTRHRTKTNKTKNTTQKTKKMSNTNPTKKPEMNPGASEALFE